MFSVITVCHRESAINSIESLSLDNSDPVECQVGFKGCAPIELFRRNALVLPGNVYYRQHMHSRKAITYLRVSGQGQIEGDGITRQREAVTRYARTSRIEVVSECRDDGVSGTRELENRPGLAAVLDLIESCAATIVLVERADRLARDLMVNEIILERFRSAGATVLTAEGQELTADDDPTRKLIRQVLGAVSEYDKTVTVLKLRAARERIRRRSGRCEGRKPYGALRGESDVLNQMRQLRRKRPGQDRRSFASIADELNNRGVPTRTGNPWQARTVYYGILTRATGVRTDEACTSPVVTSPNLKSR